MEKQIMSIFTRTPMHIGAGSSVGVVDLPIIRERHTGYPVIPGSSLKGVLADLWNDEENTFKTDKGLRRKKGSDAEKLFGCDRDPQKAAVGNLLVGEGRILVFPVRSVKGGFAWITCPLALGRYFRDCDVTDVTIPKIESESCCAAKALKIEDKIILEEYMLTCSKSIQDDVLVEIVEKLSKVATDSLWANELASHLVIVSDEMFKYFVEYTCEIAQHVKIDDIKGVAKDGGLFQQENVPAETMFYVPMHELEDGMLDLVATKLEKAKKLIQLGGDMTTGLGWCSVSLMVLA